MKYVSAVILLLALSLEASAQCSGGGLFRRSRVTMAMPSSVLQVRVQVQQPPPPPPVVLQMVVPQASCSSSMMRSTGCSSSMRLQVQASSGCSSSSRLKLFHRR